MFHIAIPWDGSEIEPVQCPFSAEVSDDDASGADRVEEGDQGPALRQ
jgi:hypothetical protein